MILTKTPFRVSIFGGGSDLEAFYGKSEGAVLSFTINKYMYISSHNYFEPNKIRVKYSQTETVDQVSELKHPILKEVLKKFDVQGGIEISSIADIPSGTGMGSSSSFTVGLLHNLYTRHHRFADKHHLGAEASDIEINKLKEPIGKQDQYAAAFGGLNVFRFKPSGQVQVESIHLPQEIFKKFQSQLMLFYTGVTRSASEVLTEQKNNMSADDKFKTMQKMVSLVDIGRDYLYQGRLEEFGQLMHEGWLLKKQMASKISNDGINELYDKAMSLGAIGGKLLGAGGGGFLLFMVPEEKQDHLRKNLGLRQLPFQIEFDGSKVIYFEEE